MATSQLIILEIVTPDGVALRQDVEELTAPSVNGEVGVLPGHQPLLAALTTGIVGLKTSAGEERVAVGPGFVEVLDDHALLLTSKFLRKKDVDPVRARLALKEADEALDHFAGSPGGPEHAELLAQELWAAAQLELYGDPPPPILRTYYEMQAAPAQSYAELPAAPHDEDSIEALSKRGQQH